MKEIQATEVAQRLANGEKLNLIDVREMAMCAGNFGMVGGQGDVAVGAVVEEMHRCFRLPATGQVAPLGSLH